MPAKKLKIVKRYTMWKGGTDQYVSAADYDALKKELTELQETLLHHSFQRMEAFTEALTARNQVLEQVLRRADDIEHSISAEDWYKARDAALAPEVKP